MRYSEQIQKLNQNHMIKKLDAAMEKLVEIMSSDKYQVKTILTTNAQLEKQIYEKNATTTQLTKEITNLVNMINKNSSKKNATNSSNNKSEKLSFDRSRSKIQMIPH